MKILEKWKNFKNIKMRMKEKKAQQDLILGVQQKSLNAPELESPGIDVKQQRLQNIGRQVQANRDLDVGANNRDASPG